MNYIWCLMIIVSIVVSIFNGTVDQTIKKTIMRPSSTVRHGRRCRGNYPAATARQAAADTATAIRSPVKFAAVSAARASPTAPKSGRTEAPITAGAASPPPTKACGAQTAREIPSDAASGGRSGTTSPWISCGAP